MSIRITDGDLSVCQIRVIRREERDRSGSFVRQRPGIMVEGNFLEWVLMRIVSTIEEQLLCELYRREAETRSGGSFGGDG